MRRIWISAGACLAISACAHTVKPATQDQKNIGSVAAAPLKDLGLVRPEAPRQLADIAYPYDLVRLTSGCAQISYEIGSLDALLGQEFYTAPSGVSDRAGQAAMGAAEGAASGLIPFRGVVRTVTGANRAQANVEHAIEMGVLRRAFLRGYGAAQGCTGMLPDAPGVRQTPPPQPPANAAGPRP
jgi:hypothetical protein